MIGAGTTLSERYRIVRQIGQGGMATVYLAEDMTLNRTVAIKVLRPELAQALGVQRFLREIDIAAKLDHPHIVPIYDAGESNGACYYVMRHVEGESLADALHERGELPIEEAARLLRDVAEGLAHAHAKGVVHRDIKPDNVLVAGRRAAVSDFGIAKAVTEATKAQSLTATGLALGTPTYMAPEQVAAEPTVDQRADVYAFGITAYEALTGNPPFERTSAQQVMAAHVTQAPTPLDQRRSTVPPEWNALVMRCLEKRPADRFQSGEELLGAIEAIGTGANVAPAVAVGRRSSTVPIAAGAAIVLASVIAWLTLGRSDTRTEGRALDPNTIAVLPFAPSTTDTALVRIGRDLALTMSYNLDGLGGLSTADAHALLARTAELTTGLTGEQAGDLAADYGAGRTVRGNLLRVGNQVRVEVRVDDVESGETVARAQLETDPDDYRTLTDSITRLLLPQLWSDADRPSPRLTVVLDRPLDAVRAFLDGERAYAQGRFTSAEEHYRRAVDADSTFWLAYARYASSRGWNLRGSPPWVGAYRDHLDELPERDRLVTEAYRLSEPALIDTLRKLAARYDDYTPIVMAYAERLVHVGTYHGHTVDDAIAVLRRVVELHPSFVPAWHHIAIPAIMVGDTATARDAIEHLEALGAAEAFREEWGYDEIGFERLELAALTDAPDLETRLTELTKAMADAEPSWDPGQRFTAYRLALAAPQLSLRFNEATVATTKNPEIVRAHRFAAARTMAARGAWDSALVMIDRYHRAGEFSNAAIEAYRLAAVGTWLGALQPERAEELRAAAATAASGPGSMAELGWLDGLVAYARNDQAGIVRAQNAVDAAGYDTIGTRLMRQSLAGLAQGLDNDWGAAGATLAELEEGYQNTRLRPPYLSSVNRLGAARWLVASGDTVRAERLLHWVGGLITNHQLLSAGMSVAPMALIERARIADARGRSLEAMGHYERFLRFYDLPPNEAGRRLQTEAESALARLRGLREPEPNPNR